MQSKKKIRNGKYVELEKLLPNLKRFRVSGAERRTSFDVLKKDGLKYLVQNDSDEKDNKITNIKKWDEAFRIYAPVYTNANPTRGAELLQYMHNIHLANSSYQWDNVMYYDHCFRSEMGDHPERNWATTNTQMWSLAMRDPVQNSQKGSGWSGQSGSRKGAHDWKGNVCWKYNRNKCKRGTQCRFDHICSYCGSPQHIFYDCPRKDKKFDKPCHNKGNNKKASDESNVVSPDTE